MRKFLSFSLVLVLLLGTFASLPVVKANAAEPEAAKVDPDDLSFFKNIEVHGFASSAYIANFNNPQNRTNNLRVFDTNSNSFMFDVGELVLKKEASKPGDIGFRTDLAYGYAVPQVIRSTPGLTTATGTAVNNQTFDVLQGYVSYNAPIGNGVKMDLGKFVTHMGAEVIEGPDNINYNYSHSYLFGFAMPFTHTGLRAAYTVNDQLTVLGMLTNGWDNAIDTNNGKTWCAQIAYALLSNVSLVFNYTGGPEAQIRNPGNEKGWRNLYGIVATIGLTDNLILLADLDYGTDPQNSAIAVGRNASWGGGAGTLRYEVNKWFYLNLRGERFDDPDGSRTGFSQRLWEMTFTPEFRIHKYLIVRPEYRHDQSNILAFGGTTAATPRKNQDTLAVNAVFYF